MSFSCAVEADLQRSPEPVSPAGAKSRMPSRRLSPFLLEHCCCFSTPASLGRKGTQSLSVHSDLVLRSDDRRPLRPTDNDI